MKISGANAIVKCLLEQGVDTVFGYPGGRILPLYDALYDGAIRHIRTSHEQGPYMLPTVMPGPVGGLVYVLPQVGQELLIW